LKGHSSETTSNRASNSIPNTHQSRDLLNIITSPNKEIKTVVEKMDETGYIQILKDLQDEI
jgi:uncharacterized protein YwgA